MNNNFKLTDDLLWDYADGLLPDAEKVQVEAYLRQYPEWQETLDAIRAEKQSLFSLPLEMPRADFADRVMAAWAAEQVLGRSVEPAKQKDRVIYVIAAVFAVLILAPIITMIASAVNVQPEQLMPQSLPVVAWDWSAVLASPLLQYAFYLTLTFVTLRFVEKLVQRRMAVARLA